MPTKEQTIEVDQDRSSKSRPKKLDRTPKPSKVYLRCGFVYCCRRQRPTATKAPQPDGPLTPEMLGKMNRYWRAANYLCIGQIYLFENPLLREPLKAEQIKPRLLGHWGTSPGQNLIYIHLNRLIKERDANIIYIAGPGHGGPSLNACSYLEGTYTEVHQEITPDENGPTTSFPKVLDAGRRAESLWTHVPNSMHEGGSSAIRWFTHSEPLSTIPT